MRTFSPTSATIIYRRSWHTGYGRRDEPTGRPEGWGPWIVHVHVRGPRRLSSGLLSDRTVVAMTFREAAAEGSSLVIPEYLRPAVDAWRPAPEGSGTPAPAANAARRGARGDR